MSADRVRIEIRNYVAHVILSRPDKMNALDEPMINAIVEAGESLKSNGDVRVVVLSGEGRSFCAGLDMQSFAGMLSAGNGGDASGVAGRTLADRTHGDANLYQQLVMVWRQLPVPVIAAVHGAALGGGFQLALGADIRCVSSDAKMSILEIKWGLVPDLGGTVLMHSMARDDIIRELTYTGRMFSGDEALRYGFATHVSDDPIGQASSLAEEIACKSPHAIEAAKRIYNKLPYLSQSEALLQESVEQDKIVLSPNQLEAISAAMEKRSPKFGNAR